MMYSFTDTTEQPGAQGRPAEAMSYNGVYLEDVIPGYRTLHVRGRELSTSELILLDSHGDGARYRRSRIPSRKITVRYQLIAESNAAFRNAFIAMNRILSAREAKIIFYDEPDKYFIGSVTDAAIPDGGHNVIVSEFTIVCADPVKYAVSETVVNAVSGEIDVDYAGTYPACPVLEAVAASDLGFVAYADEAGHVIQIGDPEEVDATPGTKSEVLIDADFRTAMPSGWSANTAYDHPNRNAHTIVGTLKAGSAAGDGLSTRGGGGYGTAEGWHGPTHTKTVPADSGGTTGASKWSVDFWHLWHTASVDECGTFWVSVEAGSGNNRQNIAAMVFVKSEVGSNQSRVELVVMGEIVKIIYFDSAYCNPVTGFPPDWPDYATLPGQQTNPGAGHHSIRKFGSKVTFLLAGTAYEFDGSDALADLVAKEVSVRFEQRDEKSPVGANILRTLSFTSHSVDSWDDVPNKFKSGDIITADTKDASISVNGVIQHGLGALGNAWEDFRLVPGENRIACMYSDFASPAPAFSLRYRAAYR